MGEVCTQLSDNFSLGEFLRSQEAARLGLDMTPPAAVIDNLRRLCRDVLQPLRDSVGPVVITSGYRSPELNRIIGGAATSQHLYGLAADIVVPGMEPLYVCSRVQGMFFPFDQLIHEFWQWTHVSVAQDGECPRGQVLTASRGADGRVRYDLGLNPVGV